jgi:deoxycytidine triphosphate deaminase
MRLENGFMNDTEIQKAIAENEIAICPYDLENLTPVGYNLSFSRFIVSLPKKSFVKIQKKNNEWYFYLKPGETVLVLTRESLWVSRFIGGTFHSKVSMVTKGVGHISTTLDPGWQGQLLVPINNTTRQKIPIVIAKEENGVRKYSTFLTMVLFRSENASFRKTDNKASRLELLEQILASSRNYRHVAQPQSILKEIKENLNHLRVYDDLNDPRDRRAKIDEYKKVHEKMILDMDNAFDHINRISIDSYTRRSVVFWLIVTVVAAALLVIGLVGPTWQGGDYMDYVNILLIVAIPFSLLGLNHLKDKLI